MHRPERTNRRCGTKRTGDGKDEDAADACGYLRLDDLRFETQIYADLRRFIKFLTRITRMNTNF
jgi:hypothetical protein